MLKGIIASLLMQQTTVAIAAPIVKAHAEAAYASGDSADGVYPDPKLTPGVVDKNANAKAVCKDGYTKAVRNVSEVTKRQVFAEYGIPWSKHAGYEVDHFISLELGGSNDLGNLWPEPYAGAFGARQKDVVENYLHKSVCGDKMTLKEAQDLITKDWVAVYGAIRKLDNSAKRSKKP